MTKPEATRQIESSVQRSAVASNLDGSPNPSPAPRPSAKARLMTTLIHEVREFDEANIKGIKEDMETVLTFAGLFSAALTAFTVESFKQLQPDPHTAAVFLLGEIARQMNQTLVDPNFLNQFRPSSVSSSSKSINALWLSSLFLSLVTASLAMLAKQWLREFLDLNDTPEKFLNRHRGLTAYRVFEITAFLPLLLQLALLFFFVGLSIFIFSLDSLIGWSTATLVGFWIVSYAISLILPAFSYSCPYKTPMLTHIRAFIVHGLLTKSRKPHDEELDLYSISRVKHRFHLLAPRGREAEIMRKLVELIPELEYYSDILDWVDFMGGMKNIPVHFRPVVRRCIAYSGTGSSSVMGWEKRLAAVFADVADSDADRQALRDIMKYLASKYKTERSDYTDAVDILLGYAIKSQDLSMADRCSLIEDVGGMSDVPPNVLPTVRQYLVQHVTTYASTSPHWLLIAKILFEETGAVGVIVRRTLLTKVPPMLKTLGEVAALIRVVDGMRMVPEKLRPGIRATILNKPDGSVDPEDKLGILLDGLAAPDAEVFNTLLQHALTWFRSPKNTPGLPSDRIVFMDSFMSKASSDVKFLAEQTHGKMPEIITHEGESNGVIN